VTEDNIVNQKTQHKVQLPTRHHVCHCLTPAHSISHLGLYPAEFHLCQLLGEVGFKTLKVRHVLSQFKPVISQVK
jgi:hypothetical protein